ncbi:MAG: cation diffusion facilitator family transporter [Acidimicrobiia bacterium]
MHGHGGHATSDSALVRRALWVALVLNAGFLVVEVVAGIVFDSLALLADAAHMATDVAGLAIALVAQSLMLRPSSARRTFGLRRAEALGGLANGVLILVTSAWIFYEAARRIGEPHDVEGIGILVVATLGLLVNLGSAWMLARAPGRDLNLRGALLHMLSDAAGSVGVMIVGVGVLALGADWLDPVMSVLIGVLVAWAAWGLLRDALNVLLEGAPRHLDVDEVEAALAAGPEVEAVHHLHVWEIGSDLPALSAHVVLADAGTLHEAQERGDALKVMLAERFGIEHVTLELECHGCDTPDHD